MRPTQTNLDMNQRQALIQELMAMLTGQQPGSQAQTGYNGVGMGGVDYAGLVNNKYNADVGAYNNKQQGIGTLIGTALGFI
jgi:hypothetical protein